MNKIIRVAFDILSKNRGMDRIYYLGTGVRWAIQKRLGCRFQTRLWNGVSVSVQPSDTYSGIFYFRYPEGKDLEFLRANAFLSDTFVDVGANVGLFSAFIFDKFANVHLFEPSPDSYGALLETAQLNQNICQITTHNIGIGARREVLRFLQTGHCSTVNRFLKADQHPDATARVIDISLDTLDAALGDRIDSCILKIDVEGFEEQVFIGAGNLFAMRKVKLVMFERLGRTNLNAITHFLCNHDYQVFRIKDNGSISTHSNDISQECINLFACPSGTLESLKLVN